MKHLAILAAGLLLVLRQALLRRQRRRRRPPTPYKAYVDMKTFMEHVLTPAATPIWRSNGWINDYKGLHDLSPKTNDDWETIESGAATLAEATNAMMIPGRARDDQWNHYVQILAASAQQAYIAAGKHDIKGINKVSDSLDGVCAACHKHYGLE